MAQMAPRTQHMAQILQLVQQEKSASSSHTLVRLRASCNNSVIHFHYTAAVLNPALAACVHDFCMCTAQQQCLLAAPYHAELCSAA